jgi:hypothetical protein
MYLNGSDLVQQDLKEAYKYLLLAARQGNADACHSLGLMYESGDGVAKDTQEAFRWFQLASNQGMNKRRRRRRRSSFVVC